MAVATLILTFDTKTQDLQLQCDPGSMLDEDRSLLYLMVERAKETVILRQLENTGPKRVHSPSPPPDKREFGKGTKTDVNGV